MWEKTNHLYCEINVLSIKIILSFILRCEKKSLICIKIHIGWSNSLFKYTSSVILEINYYCWINKAAKRNLLFIKQPVYFFIFSFSLFLQSTSWIFFNRCHFVMTITCKSVFLQYRYCSIELFNKNIIRESRCKFPR